MQFPVNGQFGIPVNDTDLKITITGEHPTTWFWTISDCDLKEGQYLQVRIFWIIIVRIIHLYIVFIFFFEL